MISDANKPPLHLHLRFTYMSINSLLAPLDQVLRKLCLFKPWQCRESLPGTAVPGRYPEIAPHSNCHNSYLTPPIELFLSILESSLHELHKTYGCTLVHPSLRGWEAFATLGALTHTRITWALSPTASQVPGVTLGSPLCSWCFGHSWRKGARQSRWIYPPNWMWRIKMRAATLWSQTRSLTWRRKWRPTFRPPNPLIVGRHQNLTPIRKLQPNHP